jgi:hypothetical protein
MSEWTTITYTDDSEAARVTSHMPHDGDRVVVLCDDGTVAPALFWYSSGDEWGFTDMDPDGDPGGEEYSAKAWRYPLPPPPGADR